MALDPSELTTHTLLRINGAEALITDARQFPAWAVQAARHAPWVVVRRAPAWNSLIAVGLRGELRSQRLATWLPPSAIIECVTPRRLATMETWKNSPCRRHVPALQMLDRVAPIMRDHGLEHQWGPTGSVGFELASSVSTVTQLSDLDLALHLEKPWPVGHAQSLHSELAALPVRIDLLVEMPHGAVALSEYATAQGAFILRTTRGPRLVGDPWTDGETRAAA